MADRRHQAWLFVLAVAAWLGWRGATLHVVAFIYFLIGLSVWINPMPDPFLFHTHLPIWLRLAFWWSAAFFAVIAAWVKIWRGQEPCHLLQSWGFGGALVPALQRFLSYFYAMTAQPNLERLTASAVWLLVATFMVILMFGLKETPPRFLALALFERARNRDR